jgi:predicted transcriptional regulator
LPPKTEPEFTTPAMPLTKRQLQLNQIKQLRSEGITIRAIARTLKISRITVRKYLHLDEPPRKNGNRTNIESFNDYLQSRMEEDKNVEVIQLWKEIKQLGYNGGRTAVYIHLKDYVKPRERIKLPTLNYISCCEKSRIDVLRYLWLKNWRISSGI